VVSAEQVEHFTAHPPQDTRAWTRAMLLKRAATDNVEVESVDWDRITFKLRGSHSWPTYRTLMMADPLGFTQNLTQPIFDRCPGFADMLDGLESLSSGSELPLNAISVN